MAYEIIYTCDSLNNKNVRKGELNILKKYEEQLYFVFGANEMNTKKRFYDNIETLNKDFDNLLKLKEKEEKEEKKEIKEVPAEEAKEIVAEVKKKVIKQEKDSVEKKSASKLDKYKIIKRKK